MFQASHRKLAYVVCGQNRRRLLEASMGWYIRHHWHGTVWYGKVWYGMVWHGMARYGMRGHIRHHCQDNVSHRYWGSVSGENDCLNPKVLETPCFCRAHCRSCQLQCNVSKWSHFLKFWSVAAQKWSFHSTCVRSNLLSSEPCNSIWSTQLAGSWQGAGTQALITRSKGGQRCPVDCPTQLIG